MELLIYWHSGTQNGFHFLDHSSGHSHGGNWFTSLAWTLGQHRLKDLMIYVWSCQLICNIFAYMETCFIATPKFHHYVQPMAFGSFTCWKMHSPKWLLDIARYTDAHSNAFHWIQHLPFFFMPFHKSLWLLHFVRPGWTLQISCWCGPHMLHNSFNLAWLQGNGQIWLGRSVANHQAIDHGSIHIQKNIGGFHGSSFPLGAGTRLVLE